MNPADQKSLFAARRGPVIDGPLGEQIVRMFDSCVYLSWIAYSCAVIFLSFLNIREQWKGLNELAK